MDVPKKRDSSAASLDSSSEVLTANTVARLVVSRMRKGGPRVSMMSISGQEGTGFMALTSALSGLGLK